MSTKKKLFLWLVSIFFLLAIQTTTYFLLGPALLEQDLYDSVCERNYSNKRGFLAYVYKDDKLDTASVQNYPVDTESASQTNESIYLDVVHDLKADHARWERRLRVEHLVFRQKEDGPNDNAAWGKSEDVSYVTSAWLNKRWWTLFDVYKARQKEELTLKRYNSTFKETTYHWFFCVWIKRMEYYAETDLVRGDSLLREYMKARYGLDTVR
jgi:hypothetical protein